jgi:hypothetical protein
VDASVPEASAGPTAISVGGESPTPLQGGDGGELATDLCPANQVIVGYAGTLTDPGILLVGSVQATCAALVAMGDGGVTTRADASLTARGQGTLSPWTQACPANAVVVGFSGGSGVALDRIAIACAELHAVDGGIAQDPPTSLPAAGGDGGTAFDDPCPPGQVARGNVVRAGEWIDALGLVCGTPSL